MSIVVSNKNLTNLKICALLSKDYLVTYKYNGMNEANGMKNLKSVMSFNEKVKRNNAL